MYPELQDLKSRNSQQEVHSLDLPQLDSKLNVKNYLISRSHLAANELEDIALLDSATIHTILRNPEYFDFETTSKNPVWKSCILTTISSRRNFQIREGQAKLMLPGRFHLSICHAMLASATPHSLLSYKDLRAQGIHLTTMLVDDEEAIEF